MYLPQQHYDRQFVLYHCDVCKPYPFPPCRRNGKNNCHKKVNAPACVPECGKNQYVYGNLCEHHKFKARLALYVVAAGQKAYYVTQSVTSHSVKDIQMEIMKYGPVVAGFNHCNASRETKFLLDFSDVAFLSVVEDEIFGTLRLYNKNYDKKKMQHCNASRETKFLLDFSDVAFLSVVEDEIFGTLRFLYNKDYGKKKMQVA
ncbi:unnamed protein product [Strongylus vulgaris]|uniref:Uncharacterized protein n=1 Tax=Strongylus vulgaris TaxID=40348 RepID=A0A3P7J0L0_STRVU|nr:unnamed protein product [Strongylus vulgaris]